MTKIIVFNGPPGSGKDTSADYLVYELMKQGFNVYPQILKFAEPIKSFVRDFYFEGDQVKFNKHDSTQLKKETISDDLFGKSCREVQIAFSENFLKTFHGETIFGDLLKSRILKEVTYSDIFVISDSGFQVELDVLIEEFGLDNIFLVRMLRNNCDFSNDSRGYLEPHFEDNFYIIDNNGTVNDLYLEIKTLVKELEHMEFLPE